MKILRIGDPHVRPSNIQESELLMEFVLNKALEYKVDRLEILGDLFDTMDVVRLKVLEFWDRWFDILPDFDFETVILIGNHDLSGDYLNSYSVLHPFVKPARKNFKIITSGCQLGIYGYLPYIHDNTKFVENANWLADHGAKVLISHTTYQGSKFDNGMFAPDGVNTDLLDPRLIHLISGHIHSEQEFGRVWYPGTARWLSKSCANRLKGIWLVEHDDNTGVILSKEFISTESVCIPIVSLVWKEGEGRPEIPTGAKVDIELHGSSDWVTKQKVELVGRVSISSKLTDTKKKVRKSGKSLYEFLSHHYQAEPEKRTKLLKYMGDLNLV